MAGTKIIIDLDRVLFDTGAFIDGLFESVKQFGVSRDKWDEALKSRDADGIFRIERQAQLLAGGRKHKGMIKAMQSEADDALWYLYADARPFLERLMPYGELHLLTLGERDLQTRKIDATGIRPYFLDVTIVEQPKHEARLPFSTVDHAIFINDNIREMTEVAGIYRWAKHLHVNRAGEALPTTMPFESYPSLEAMSDRVLTLLNPKVTT